METGAFFLVTKQFITIKISKGHSQVKISTKIDEDSLHESDISQCHVLPSMYRVGPDDH